MPLIELSGSADRYPGHADRRREALLQLHQPLLLGVGEKVELGPRLGLSPAHLVGALRDRAAFRRRHLRVFDDFVWRREWIPPALAGTSLSSPPDHGSFLDLSEEQVREYSDSIEVHRGRLVEFDGNEALEPVRWHGAPIEMIVVDCGRSLAVNEAWWRTFQQSFIPDRTLIAMQDWGCYAAVPEVWWENTELFTDWHSASLDLVHELRDGALATFVYRTARPVE